MSCAITRSTLTTSPRKPWRPKLVYHRSSSSRRLPFAAIEMKSPWPSSRRMKALAQLTGNRKIDMLPVKEVQAATGYIRGGVTALACKKEYPVYIDELAEICDLISVSAGIRGLQILLAPRDYIRAVNATV